MRDLSLSQNGLVGFSPRGVHVTPGDFAKAGTREIVFKRRSSKPEDDVKTGGGASPLSLAKGPAQAPAKPAAPSAAPRDGSLGVPPFRPSSPKDKDPTDMARPPFPPSPTAVPTMPPAPNRPTGMMGSAPRATESAERRTLVVGRGISVQGTITDAERLVVEGTVEATMIHAAELSVIQGGVFKGEVEVEEAEIAGTIDGVVTARTSLIVRATGRVIGRARCRRLQVEDGGQITGQIEMLTEALSASPSAPAPAPTQAVPASDFDRPAAPATV